MQINETHIFDLQTMRFPIQFSDPPINKLSYLEYDFHETGNLTPIDLINIVNPNTYALHMS